MDLGQHNWVWDRPPVSRLKLSQFHLNLSPHLIVISRPGHGILSRYWNSHFTGTMVRHPHHDNIEWVGLGQWILILYYLTISILYPHPVQSLPCGSKYNLALLSCCPFLILISSQPFASQDPSSSPARTYKSRLQTQEALKNWNHISSITHLKTWKQKKTTVKHATDCLA